MGKRPAGMKKRSPFGDELRLADCPGDSLSSEPPGGGECFGELACEGQRPADLEGIGAVLLC